MEYVIQIYALADGGPSEEEGSFIREFIPDTDAWGRGTLLVTDNQNEALTFASTGEAWEYWKQQSKRVPTRPDGKPNRPLTAYTVSIHPKGEKGWPNP
jgi:hypothetical protein